jgi:hypothetical protein
VEIKQHTLQPWTKENNNKGNQKILKEIHENKNDTTKFMKRSTSIAKGEIYIYER